MVKAGAVLALAVFAPSIIRGFVMSSNNVMTLSRGSVSPRARTATTRMTADSSTRKVLVLGDMGFSDLYLTKELHARGHEVVVYSDRKVANRQIPGESDEEYAKRCDGVETIVGSRTKFEACRSTLGEETFDAVYDMNARDVEETKAMVELFKGKVDHYVFMSSAEVYLASKLMPHREGDELDPETSQKVKLESEAYLEEAGMPYTSIRPTYIYGPLNDNLLEQYFFERLDQNRTVIVPGHGQHLVGLGHVEDIARAMANVLGRQRAVGQIYNIQDNTAITLDGIVRACAKAMGKDPAAVDIKHFNPDIFDFGEGKAFPVRPAHFFTSCEKAMTDLDWAPQYGSVEGFRDSYRNDFVHKKEAGGLINAFECDDMVLDDQRIGNLD